MKNEMPEKIWVDRAHPNDRSGHWKENENPKSGFTLYTRSDIHAEVTAERDRLREALEVAIDELDLIVFHYHPVGRHEGDLSLAKETLPQLIKALEGREEG